jgi:hypothetical protein
MRGELRVSGQKAEGPAFFDDSAARRSRRRDRGDNRQAKAQQQS